ncbi:hypothetical protein ACFX2I_018852 [Malus domestica]
MSSTIATGLHHGNHRDGHHDHYYLRQGPWHRYHGPSRAIQGSQHQGHDPSHVILSPTRTQCVAKPSPSLAPMCITLRAAHSHGLTCSR